jgi:hypothetical protein
MSEQMNTQDNRITAEPIWQVCYDKEHVTADGYERYVTYGDISDGEYELIFSSEEGSSADNKHAIEWLKENKPDFCEIWAAGGVSGSIDDMNFEYEFDQMGSINIQKNFMVRRREVVKSCLTEADANWFIKRKQHDYPKLYTYVNSMVYCPQMIELRNWIKTLSPVK